MEKISATETYTSEAAKISNLENLKNFESKFEKLNDQIKALEGTR